MGLGIKDLLLNGLVVWASSVLFLGGPVIKYQQVLQTGTREVIWSLLSQKHGAQCQQHGYPCSPHTHTPSCYSLPQRNSAETLMAT